MTFAEQAGAYRAKPAADTTSACPAFTATTAAIVAAGSLSFLGFGLRPPDPSWGGVVAEGRTALGSAPLAPAAVLCLTVLALNCLGEQSRSPALKGVRA